jgi:hypothetical protein
VKTNYQILPGDRVYILSQPLTKFDTYFARVLSPVQRAMGITLYGASTINAVKQIGQNNIGGNGTNLFLPIQ